MECKRGWGTGNVDDLEHRLHRLGFGSDWDVAPAAHGLTGQIYLVDWDRIIPENLGEAETRRPHPNLAEPQYTDVNTSLSCSR